MSQNPRPEHFLDLAQWSGEQLGEVLSLAVRLKSDPRKYARSLTGKTLAMIFTKSSTRTRVSFEVGMFQLGGHAIFMSSAATQVGRGEPLEDTARVLSRYVDGIMVRTYAHEDVELMARYASIPVINGLTDLVHPCQVLTDVFTIMEQLGLVYEELQGLPIAYIGDGNNMANSWINAARIFGLHLKLACPRGYEPDAGVLARFNQDAGAGRVEVLTEASAAAAGARVLNTDVWASMGQEKEAAIRRRVFQGYQINDELLRIAAPGALVLHCLPAHRGEEITAAVFERCQDVIFTQAENRLHVQKALLLTLLGSAD
ncbi:MAG TPA: ornithine carbamoyltransferase [Proteobacteria bacterium]|nr:ornithine carbamoyltransferase [Pseudomonadota bacterium]